MAENIYQKLLKIQQKINGLGKDKSTLNYKYVTGDKVLGEIKPLMNEMGIILKQEIISIDNVRHDYKVGKQDALRDKSEINSKVMMRFTWVDCVTGEKDENLFGANGQNDWDKGVGSALTYGERYFLLKYFHIATDEDDIDNPDRKPDENEHSSPAPTEWLNEGTEPWKEMELRIQSGEDNATVLKDMKDKWRVNKKCEEAILAMKKNPAYAPKPAADKPTGKPKPKLTKSDSIDWNILNEATPKTDFAKQSPTMKAYNNNVTQLSSGAVSLKVVTEHYDLDEDVRVHYEAIAKRKE